MRTTKDHMRTTESVSTLDPPRSRTDATLPAHESPPADTSTVNYVWAVLRISLGWVFLWAFLDKTFGFGAATESDSSWIEGGSPTEGYLSFATRGPLKGWFDWMAGDVWADWLFMIALLGIALALGIGMRIAAASGATLLLFMWAAAPWPENNPFMDDHIVYAITVVGLALVNAGDHWGVGQWWNSQPTVHQHPILR